MYTSVCHTDAFTLSGEDPEGAGFYLNETQEPWSKNSKMYTYIVDELKVIASTLVPHFSGKVPWGIKAF